MPARWQIPLNTALQILLAQITYHPDLTGSQNGGVIYANASGVLSANRRPEQEISMRCLAAQLPVGAQCGGGTKLLEFSVRKRSFRYGGYITPIYTQLRIF